MREGFEEINSFKPVAFPDAPDDVANYLSSLSSKTTVDLQKQFLKRPWSEIFSRQSDFDLEWIFGTMHSIICGYDTCNCGPGIHQRRLQNILIMSASKIGKQESMMHSKHSTSSVATNEAMLMLIQNMEAKNLPIRRYTTLDSAI
ncbi:hypothetical protein BC943DRAFT_382781 [Umbelopsis sp. AD052]|nr:hypothetical protein BC943DRAFT_382781 [Umbelopsis sp. AD052]